MAGYPLTIAGQQPAGDWTAANPTLAQFELGVESDTGRMKLGDGRTAWSSLTYLNTPGLGATQVEIDQANDVSAYQESIVAAGALSVTKKYSGLSLVGAGAVTLAAPDASMLGQVKVIEMVTDNGDVTLALTNVVGGTAATSCKFDDAGDQLVLIAGAAKWIVLKQQGVVLT